MASDVAPELPEVNERSGKYTPCQYIDSHCHFDASRFDGDRDHVWKSCLERNVRTLVVPGMQPKQWSALISLAAKYSGIYFGVGLHPWCVAQFIETFDCEDNAFKALETEINRYFTGDHSHSNSEQQRCIAVGECGLDKVIDTSFSLQQRCFELHLQMAQNTMKPVIVHSRKAHAEVMAHIKYFPDVYGVIHAFSGSYEQAKSYWSRGFYLGVGGTITYPRAQKTRDAIKRLPLDALVLETDAPDMPFYGRQGKRNSPEFLAEAAIALADIRTESYDTIVQQVYANTVKLYALNI